jgi:hypothetical protein
MIVLAQDRVEEIVEIARAEIRDDFENGETVTREDIYAFYTSMIEGLSSVVEREEGNPEDDLWVSTVEIFRAAALDEYDKIMGIKPD